MTNGDSLPPRSRGPAPKRRVPSVTDIEFEPAGPGWDESFLGWASLNVGGIVRILRIEVHNQGGNRLLLVYPINWQPYGVRSGVMPLDRDTYLAISQAVHKHIRARSRRRSRKGGRP